MTTDPLSLIAQYESGGGVPGGGSNVLQGVVSPNISTASGYYQITNTTWGGIPSSITQGYPTAMSAPAGVQANAAAYLYNQSGFASWAPYNSNLSAAISAQGGAGAFPVPGSYQPPTGLPGEGDSSGAALTYTCTNCGDSVSNGSASSSSIAGQQNSTAGTGSGSSLPGLGSSGTSSFFGNLLTDISNIFVRGGLVLLGIVLIGVAAYYFAQRVPKGA